ncbi:MAG: amidohydrolase family protein, partial [Burkholderiaceae bacterium]|nr:amidohydrolase family protein [Burkholderiaceae bacterium]
MTAPHLWRHARLATFAPGSPWGWIEDGTVITEGDRITWVGADADLLALASAHRQPAAEIDLQGALVTPGLVDAHTHLVYGGDRAAEFEQRLHGATYEEIARAGGGIRA